MIPITIGCLIEMTKKAKSNAKPRVKIELILSIAAIVISLVALLFSYLESPLSDARIPKLYYSYSTARAPGQDPRTTAYVGAYIENRSRNPAENVIVAITILADEEDDPAHPFVVVESAVEYTVLSRDKNLTVLKFESFPAHFKCHIFINSYRHQTFKIKPGDGGMPDVPYISSVRHKNGYGIPE
jgi:hypothetical protein